MMQRISKAGDLRRIDRIVLPQCREPAEGFGDNAASARD